MNYKGTPDVLDEWIDLLVLVTTFIVRMVHAEPEYDFEKHPPTAHIWMM